MINYGLGDQSSLNNTNFLKEEYHYLIYYRNMYGRMRIHNIHIQANDQNRHYAHKHNMVHHTGQHLQGFFIPHLLIFHLYKCGDKKIYNMDIYLRI